VGGTGAGAAGVSSHSAERALSHWWRAYDNSVDHPKLIGLTDQQHRFWFNILCVFSAFDGRLPDIRTTSIKLRMQPRKVIRLMNDLRSAGLLDESNDLIFPHNWNIHQYKSDVSTERVKRFRERSKTVSGNVSETPPDNREQITERKKDSVLRTARGASEDFDDIPGFLERRPPSSDPQVEVVGEDPKARLFRVGKTILTSFGIAEKRTGALIGQWLKTKPDPLGVLAALQFARDQNVAEPVAYVSAVIHGKSNGVSNGQDRRPGESLGDLGRRLAAEARELERAAGVGRANEPFGGH
jgi:hypothetical protein